MFHVYVLICKAEKHHCHCRIRHGNGDENEAGICCLCAGYLLPVWGEMVMQIFAREIYISIKFLDFSVLNSHNDLHCRKILFPYRKYNGVCKAYRNHTKCYNM